MKTDAVLFSLALLFAWDFVEQIADRSFVTHMV